MNYNKIASEIILGLKKFKFNDHQIAERLGVSRQCYLRRRNMNKLTSEDLTILSEWLCNL